MAVGRPIKLTPNIARKQISVTATADQTSFTPTGGYRVNELGVYRNGVRLVQGRDFTAVDGATVTLLSACTVDDVVEFAIFDSFNIADALDSNSDNTMGGAFTLGGNLNVGLATIYNSAGIVSAVSFYGDGENLTGLANTDYINSVSVNASGIITASSFEGSGANLTGVSGFATALSTDQTSPLNKIFTTPQVLEIGAGTSIQVDSNATSGYIAFTREGRIDVATGATFAVGSGTTFITNVLDIF